MNRFWIVATLSLVGWAVAAGAQAPRKTVKAFDIALIYRKPSAVVDRVLGRPRSVGSGSRFREYSLPTAGVYVTFPDGKTSSSVTTTFRRPFARAEDALAAVALSVRGRKPDQQDTLTRTWRKLGGVAEVTAISSDGTTWDTIEVKDRASR
jgi:hypothetical protein